MRKPRAERKKKERMRPFYFRHSPEMLAFAESKAAEDNKELAAFTRDAFNAGLEVLYGVKVANYKPILPEQRTA